jgi:hypothetical protein
VFGAAMDDFITKPLERADFFQIVERCLGPGVFGSQSRLRNRSLWASDISRRHNVALSIRIRDHSLGMFGCEVAATAAGRGGKISMQLQFTLIVEATVARIFGARGANHPPTQSWSDPVEAPARSCFGPDLPGQRTAP